MSQQPSEVVVVFMNQPEHPQMPTGLNIRSIDISSDNRLPLAQARNRLAAEASNERLLFLDVDCVPAVSFAEELLRDLDLYGGLVMGLPRYLKSGAATDDDATMIQQSELNRLRTELQPGLTDAYDLFWSLCFAITKSDFEKAGGFSEDLAGYGGEDTDFAFRCREVGMQFALSSATVFHQDHSSYRPPLNHFDDIVTNALILQPRWNMWVMGGWLNSFAKLGLIDWSFESIDIKVLRHPTAEEIENARVITSVE